MKSAMVLIRDHGDILRLKKNNAAPGGKSISSSVLTRTWDGIRRSIRNNKSNNHEEAAAATSCRNATVMHAPDKALLSVPSPEQSVFSCPVDIHGDLYVARAPQ